MIAPSILFLTSLAGLAVAMLPGWSDLALLAVPCAVASLYLLLRALARPAPRIAPRHWPRPDPRQPRTAKAPKWIIVDGSNVLHWNDGTPRIETLRAVLFALTEKGYTPGVVFDANAGYKISDTYQHDRALGRMLGLPEDRVMVVPKGTPADPVVLAAARDLNARIVSNDRFRDWAEVHPEVATPGHVIRGGFRDGALWLDLAPAAVKG